MSGVAKRVDFSRIASLALSNAEVILRQWLPDGRREGSEWVSCNPRRSDRRPGSFKVSLRTGKWGDFATGAAGGDLVALAAYLGGLDQVSAAKAVAAMLGVDPHE